MDCFVFQRFWAWPFISEKFKYISEPVQLYIFLLVLFKVLVETVGPYSKIDKHARASISKHRHDNP